MDNQTEQTPSSMKPDVVAPQPPLTETPAEPILQSPKIEEPKMDAPKKSSSKKMMIIIIVMIAVVLGLAGAAYGGYSSWKSKADKTAVELYKKIALLEADEHDLPEGTTQITACVPNMGSHRLVKGGDPEYGPFLLVTKQNKVVGVEYMVVTDMYTKIPNTNPPAEIIDKASPMYGWKFDHAKVSHLPQGHVGNLHEHTDIHLYTESAEKLKNACK